VKGGESWEAWWEEEIVRLYFPANTLFFFACPPFSFSTYLANNNCHCASTVSHSDLEREDSGDYFKSTILYLPVWYCLQTEPARIRYINCGTVFPFLYTYAYHSSLVVCYNKCLSHVLLCGIFGTIVNIMIPVHDSYLYQYHLIITC